MITFFTSYLGGTHGTAKSARDFLRALLANHASVKVVAPNQEQFPDSMCDRKLSAPEWLNIPKGIQPPCSLHDFIPTKIIEWLRDKKTFRRLRSSDVVIVNGWASYDQWLLAKDLFTGPKVMIVRESPRHFSGPDRIQLPPDLIGGFSSFDCLIFVSERSCHEWRQYEAIVAKPYALLPNCCEEEDVIRCTVQGRETVREKLGFGPDDFVVICPGTIEHRKGQDLLLDVVSKLQSQIPNLRILLVGDPATKWGIDLLKAIPCDILARTVKHLRAMPDIMDLLYAADLLAFPSRAEALPRTILEAMVMKTPVVASDVDGISELIENGITGLLFKCDDSEGLCNGIISLYSSPLLRNQFAEAGFSRYWNNFSRRHQFDRMKIILNELQSSHV